MSEVADDASGCPGVGEEDAGVGFAGAEHEAVHLGEEVADFAEFRAEGGGADPASRDGGSGVGDECFVVGGFFGQEGGVGGGEVVVLQISGIFREGGTKGLLKQPGASDEFDIAEPLPPGERQRDLGRVGLAVLVLKKISEGFGNFVGDRFEFLFLPILVSGVTGGVGLLGGEEVGETVHQRDKRSGALRKGERCLVLPDRLMVRDWRAGPKWRDACSDGWRIR